jgi:heme-degrading monooxygenase HmoA
MTNDTSIRWAGGIALAMTMLGAAAAADAPPADANTPVVVVVKVAKPWYAPKSVVVGKMRETIPQYADVPGLAYKAFSFARPGKEYGGLYFWKDRASAQAWFTPAWFERVRKERGVEGEVRTFDAPVSLDNAPSASVSEGDAVATLVTIATPAGVTRERIVAEFRAAVPAHQKADGLLRKHFIISDDGRFGGLYLWRDEAAAQRWFNEAWQQRVRQTYGSEARIEWFDTPILLPSQRAGNRIELALP